MYEEDEGIEIFCPYCQKPVFVPAGYNRAVYLCPRCKKAIPLSEDIQEKLKNMAPAGEEKPRVMSPCRRDSLR